MCLRVGVCVWGRGMSPAKSCGLGDGDMLARVVQLPPGSQKDP